MGYLTERLSAPPAVGARNIQDQRTHTAGPPEPRVAQIGGQPRATPEQNQIEEAGVTLSQIDHIAIPRDPWARLGTKLLYAMRMPSFAAERARVLTRFAGIHEVLAQSFDVDRQTIRARFQRVEHHQAHLASAFFVSPFEQAAVLSAEFYARFSDDLTLV